MIKRGTRRACGLGAGLAVSALGGALLAPGTAFASGCATGTELVV